MLNNGSIPLEIPAKIHTKHNKNGKFVKKIYSLQTVRAKYQRI